MRSKSRLKPSANRPAPNEHPQDDSWVDQVADEIQALLAEHGLELELVVFYDNQTEILHATGLDGSPARYFRSLESEGGTGSSGATKGAEPVDLPPRRGSFTPSA
ncbi:MAG: hypothetical protein KGJ23_06550 [Euryarchaeota archaeon]|nr:hypothetical protein [Euryarchaeota archaeon]MDE1836260.1 hypothetical protein [Euryarchaeota archaeon]MDE2044979.1 hypothetical protein [Thermoplasmata archaeon]